MEEYTHIKITVEKSCIRINKDYKNTHSWDIDDIKELLENHSITFCDFDKFITIIGDRQCMKTLYWLSTEFYILID